MAKSVCESTEVVGMHDVVQEMRSFLKYNRINPDLFKTSTRKSMTFYLHISCYRERKAFEELIFACGGECVEYGNLNQWTAIMCHSKPFLKGKRPCFKVTYITDCIKQNMLVDISKYQLSPVTEVNPMHVIFYRKAVFCNIEGVKVGLPVEDTSTSESSLFSVKVYTLVDFLRSVYGESCYCQFGPKPGESAAPIPEPAAPTPESAAPISEPVVTIPESVAHTPEPAAPIPEPVAPVPESAAPIPEPAAPTPESAAPISEPVVTIPESVAHTPEPAAPIPEPVAPVPESAARIPEPAAPIPEPVAPVPESVAHNPVPATPIPEEHKNTRIVNKRTRMPYTWAEKEAILRYLVKFKRYKNLRGNRHWKVMEIRNVCPRRTYQSMKEHFTKALVHELDRFDFLTPEEKMIFKQYRK